MHTLNDELSIKVNTTSKPSIKLLGKSKIPVIIIDDFAHDLDEFRSEVHELGCFTDVDHKSSMYPGVRTTLPKQYVVDTIMSLVDLVKHVYFIPKNLTPKPLIYSFSLVSSKPETLNLRQRMPHYDSVQPYYFAVLHYLNDGPHGNTAFFRHNPTGFEYITEDREGFYINQAKQFVHKNGKPEAKYCVESTAHFEIVDQIEYRPNRLVIYPGKLLHSILVDSEIDIDGDPRSGRLTANIFLEFR